MKHSIIQLLCACILASSATAINLEQFVRETQRMKSSGSEMTMIWWIPTEYWEESYKQTPGMTQETIQQFTEMTDMYDIFAVLDVNVGMFGSTTGKDWEFIQEHITLIYEGQTYEPVPGGDIDMEVNAFLAMMKPVFMNMLGNFGSHFEFVVFEKDGAKMIDVAKEGSFEVQYENEAYRWRLPLAAVLPDMIDPQTNESFPGNYKFNPYTGSELIISAE